MESIEATSISISWNPPTLSSLHILYYIINAKKVNTGGITQVNTTNNATFFNVTGLLPGTSYELTVACTAAFENGNENTTTICTSQSSTFVMATTEFTGT